MTSRTLHNAATSWITYYSTFPAGSRGGALVGSLGDEVPQLKVVTSKLYAFLVVIHTQYNYEVETLIIENQWPNNLIITRLDYVIKLKLRTPRSVLHAGFSQLWKPVVVKVRSSKVARMLGFTYCWTAVGFFESHDLRYIADQPWPLASGEYAAANRRC